MHNDGSGNFAESSDAFHGRIAHDVGLGDLDGDGDLAIAEGVHDRHGIDDGAHGNGRFAMGDLNPSSGL